MTSTLNIRSNLVCVLGGSQEQLGATGAAVLGGSWKELVLWIRRQLGATCSVDQEVVRSNLFCGSGGRRNVCVSGGSCLAAESTDILTELLQLTLKSQMNKELSLVKPDGTDPSTAVWG